MLVKLREAQKVDSSKLDEYGRVVPLNSYTSRDIFINPEQVVSLSSEYSRTNEEMTRVETTKGAFVVLGSLNDIQELLNISPGKKTEQRKVLKD